MPQFVFSQCAPAEVPVTMTTAPLFDSDKPRRFVALDWISRNGGRVIGSVNSARR